MLVYHMHVTLKPLELELWMVLNDHVVARNWAQILSSARTPSALNHVSIPETVTDVKTNKGIEGMKLIANWMKQKSIH